MLIFDETRYTDEVCDLEGMHVRYRAFRNIPYVEHPEDPTHQQLNIYVPLAFYEGKEVGGYTLKTAPTFVPNMVGGYMPGELEEPGYFPYGPKRLSTILYALAHGYVCVSPALRGRNLKNEEGAFVGKAPAVIVDYKAAIRFLHAFSDKLPGDQEKIITNGTSAGGAISALMGATGNHPDYEPYLKALGACEAKDDIFAASCYCPITNLDHADAAYEWQFDGVEDFNRLNFSMDEGGRPSFTPEAGRMSEVQIAASCDLAKSFPAYVNSLQLFDEAGNALTLDEDGNGSFKEYLQGVVLASAQKVLDTGVDLSDKQWLKVEDGKAVSMDFAAYVRDITRMKTAPAFDDLTCDAPENDLFGTRSEACRHFTAYSAANSLANAVRIEGASAEGANAVCAEGFRAARADESIVKMMNPMYYIEDSAADKAPHWRIRHGECDRDSSLAISAMLTCKLKNNGYPVDYQAPWDVPHSGDYDLDELFAWIDGICK